MKKLYFSPGHEAWVNLVPSGEDFEITRVHTTPANRCRGFATHVMREVMADADAEGVCLLLVSGLGERGGMSGAELDEWYARLGFNAISPGGYPGTTLMERPPGAPEWRSA